MYVGKKVTRVDAYDKVIGRTRYTDDLCDKSAYVARIVHSTIANGRVLSIDTSEAEKIPGVVKVFTCFDLKEKHYYPTAGHPWSTDPSHQDVADRLVLTERVRFYGDDIAAVVAEDEVAAAQALHALKIEYEESPFVLDVQEAMKDGAPQLHEAYPNNILKHTTIRKGNYEEAIKEPGLIKVEGWYSTPTVQHCHIENFICYAEMEGDRIKIVSSTQIPHIVRRVVGQALGIDWGKIRIIKPYIGGGFGNKQDILYEPLCAWLCTQLNGHLIKLDVPREETFVSTRVRHAIQSHIISWVRPDGTFAARKLEAFSDQGAYASHGHSICAKGVGAFPQLYPCDNVEADGYTVFTNKSVAGAMRGYGIPQAMWAVESHTEEVAARLGMDPIELPEYWIANDFITFRFFYAGGAKEHMVNLTKHEELTADGKTLLEFRHHAYGDPENKSLYGYVSFPLKEVFNEVTDSVQLHIKYKGFDEEKNIDITYRPRK